MNFMPGLSENRAMTTAQPMMMSAFNNRCRMHHHGFNILGVKLQNSVAIPLPLF